MQRTSGDTRTALGEFTNAELLYEDGKVVIQQLLREKKKKTEAVAHTL